MSWRLGCRSISNGLIAKFIRARGRNCSLARDLTPSNVRIAVFSSLRPLNPRRPLTYTQDDTQPLNSRVLRKTVSTAAQPADALVKLGDAISLGPIETCPGCGAFAQHVDPAVAGFYSLERHAVQDFLRRPEVRTEGPNHEEDVFDEAIRKAPREVQDALAEDESPTNIVPTSVKQPLCDRCHDLVHHHSGTPIIHPSLDALAAMFAESPWKTNHIYHVVDAADFPMSLVPQVRRLMSIAPQRSKNRRAKTFTYRKGKRTEMSFIITRSDLLAPKKEQVDHMMPYLLATLRDALGSSARNVRLGNVRCVSAHRGWWVKEVKEDIWSRGGGAWLVGKVNVGKSNLFETIFPKGRMRNGGPQNVSTHAVPITLDVDDDGENLLPPARIETQYPQMPTISSLPGTTASPIRIPFGSKKGELVDLPGLSRGDLGDFVQDGKKSELVMKKRLVPAQFSITPGHSLILGGLIHIRSLSEHTNILAYPFLPFSQHLGKTESIFTFAESESPVLESIAKEGVTRNLRSAGTFELRSDVTKQKAGPLVASDAAGLKPKNLHFKVLATDILVEGVGWVELVAQVRRRDFPDDGPPVEGVACPAVEVFTPEGRFVQSRRPMMAWEQGGPKTSGSSKLRRRIKPINRVLKDRRANSARAPAESN